MTVASNDIKARWAAPREDRGANVYLPERERISENVYVAREREMVFLATPEFIEDHGIDEMYGRRISDVYIPNGGKSPKRRLGIFPGKRFQYVPSKKYRHIDKMGSEGERRMMVVKEHWSDGDPNFWVKTTTMLSEIEYSTVTSVARSHGLCVVKDRIDCAKFNGADKRLRLVVDDNAESESQAFNAKIYIYRADLYGLVTVVLRGLTLKECADLRERTPNGLIYPHGAANGCVIAGSRWSDLEDEFAERFNYREIKLSGR